MRHESSKTAHTPCANSHHNAMMPDGTWCMSRRQKEETVESGRKFSNMHACTQKQEGRGENIKNCRTVVSPHYILLRPLQNIYELYILNWEVTSGEAKYNRVAASNNFNEDLSILNTL